MARDASARARLYRGGAADRARLCQRHCVAGSSAMLSCRRTTTACRRSSRAASSDGRLSGRGACDAKGILAAQIAAAERLRASGERRVGLLFVAGEERGSDGAAAANTVAPGSRFLINGEPTGQPPGVGDPRRASRPAHGRGARGAFGASGMRRIGDRQAHRCAGAAARNRVAGAPRAGTNVLQRGSNRRRHRAQRHFAACVG